MSPLIPDVDLATLSERISARLAAVRGAMRRHFLVEGLAVLSVAIIAAAALSLLLDWRLELSRPSRFFCIGSFALLACWLAYRHLIRPLTMPLSPLDVAAAIDRSTNGPTKVRLATRVASVLELPAQLEAGEDVSQVLISRAVAASYRDLESVNFQSHLSKKHWWTSLAAIAACVLIPAAFAAGAPNIARLWRDRWLLGSDRPWPHSTVLTVLNVNDGRLVVPRGEPASVQVEVTDRSEKPTEVVWMRLTSPDGSDQTVTLNRFAPGDFRYDLPPQQQPLDVEVWGGDGRAEPFRIEPLDRPKITNLKLTAKHPREKQPETFVFTGEEGNVRLLPRTEAVLEFETNVPIADVRVDAEGASPRKFDRVTDKTFRTEWTHAGQVKMRVSLVAANSALESYPRPITIGDKPDRPPTLSVKHSGVRLRVTPRATIPLMLTARDDFGIRSVELLAAVEEAGKSSVLPDDSEEAPKPEPDQDAKPADPPAEQPAAEGDQQAKPAAVDGEVTQNGTGSSLQFTAAFAEEPVAADGKADTPPAADPTTEPPATEPADPAPPSNPESVFEEQPAAESAEKDVVAKVLPKELRTPLYGPTDPALELVIEPKHDVELSNMTVLPGQTLAVTVAAEDDCYIGRQIAQSRKLVFKVVKEEELFKEILLRQQQLRARLRRAYEQMVDLHAKLKAADVAEDGPNLLRAYLLTRREIGAVARELEASVLEMRLNKLGGPESWDLIQVTVLTPLNRLQEQELERQKQALETFTGRDPEPIEGVIERQQAIVDGLKKVLDNMSQWDSFIDIVNQVNSIIKIQEAVRKRTEELKEKQVESIFDM